MPYIRREFYTKNKDIQKYLDNLMKTNITQLPPRLAQTIGRHKTIKNIRDLDRKNPYIIIAGDQKYHISLMKIREPVKIRKKGDRYIFSL